VFSTSDGENARELLGAVNTRELRDVNVSDAVFDALVEGLSDINAQVRFWSVQLLDHCPDSRAIVAINRCSTIPSPGFAATLCTRRAAASASRRGQEHWTSARWRNRVDVDERREPQGAP
jgi:hypothetical protein